MTTSLLIDGIILALLAAALIYAAVLARRIAKLQRALLDLAPALQAFCDAVDQSERSVDEIRRETDRLQSEADRAAKLVLPSGPDAAARAAPRAKPDRSDLVRGFFEAARMRMQ